VDADGYLYIADRRIDMIVSGGANIYPAEVEAALSEHPGVADVVVIGLPDPEWGKRVHAVIQPQEAQRPPTAAQLKAFCRERLAAYKAPRTYEFVLDFPRSDAGKVQRSAMVAERTVDARPPVTAVVADWPRAGGRGLGMPGHGRSAIRCMVNGTGCPVRR
jgi:bile acid-coenzyme A ligase